MPTETKVENQKSIKLEKTNSTPIGRLTLLQLDAALAECDKTVKEHSDTVKAKLTANASIPTNVLRALSRANTQRSRLVKHRITLLIESGDGVALELIDKLMKLKLAKNV